MPVVYQLYFNKALFIFLIFISRQLIYSVVLVSGIQQSESVMPVHTPTLFQILFPYDHYRVEFPVLYSGSLLVIYLTWICVYMSITNCLTILPLHPSLVTIVCFPSLWAYFVNKFISIILKIQHKWCHI